MIIRMVQQLLGGKDPRTTDGSHAFSNRSGGRAVRSHLDAR